MLLSFISLPLKNLLISFPSIIIRLEIAFINVSIVLNVKAKAKTKIETIIKTLSFNNINLKKAKSGLVLGSIEKDIRNLKKNKSELSSLVAEKLAKKAQQKNITKIYFDRGMYKYHGRIKLFAETLRKNGMVF